MPEPAVTPEVQVDTVTIPEESKTLLSEAEVTPEVTPGETSEETKEEPAKEEEKQGAPETYADFTLPEGFVLDEEIAAEAKGIFKEYNLTQDQAQKLIDAQTKLAKKQMEQAEADFKGIVEGWKSETVKMLGAEYAKEMASAAALRAKFAPEGFEDFLDTTGLGNHPMMVKFCVAAGKAIVPDSFVRGEEKPKRGSLYPNSPELNNNEVK